jgi:ubiquinone biosynthesis protein COQ4
MQTAATPSEDYTELSLLARATRAGSALRKVLAHPEDTDQVLVFLGLINRGRSLRTRVERFFAHPVGKKLYDERCMIDSRTVDLDALAALPDGTLGEAYATFLRSRGLTPEIFDDPPHGVTDPRQSYLIQRMRQTHDLWHVATGCDTDPAGEIALQAFTFAQTGAPGNALLAGAGVIRGFTRRRGMVSDTLRMYWIGKQARSLPVFDWENHWDKPLSEVRAMLDLPRDSAARTRN